MLIETWVVVLIVIGVFAMAFVSSIGWMLSDHRYETACEANRELAEEKESLAKENAKMRFQLNLIREKIEMEMKK